MKIKDVLTHGPLIGSEKIYVPGQLFPELRVGMRRIALSDTYNEDGSRTPQRPCRLYDTGGPYTDSAYRVDLEAGLPRLREPWIDRRDDTTRSEELGSEYTRSRLQQRALDGLRLPSHLPPPSGSKGAVCHPALLCLPRYHHRGDGVRGDT